MTKMDFGRDWLGGRYNQNSTNMFVKLRLIEDALN